jgi:hypothetical protein
VKTCFGRFDSLKDLLRSVKAVKAPDAKQPPLAQSYVLLGKLVRLDLRRHMLTLPFVS